MKKVQLFVVGVLLALIINFNSLDVVGQEKIEWYTIEEVQKLNQ